MAGLANFALIASTSASAHGPVKFSTVTFTGVSSYTTDGDTGFKAGLQGLTKDTRVPVVLVDIGSAGDYATEYLPASDKLIVKVRSTGAQVTAAANLSGVTFKVLAITQ
jgi:hypothetical protein